MSTGILVDELPEALRERCRTLREAPIRDGEFILYWTHHALRAHENPALDVAVWAGNRLGLPVLVYQGLGAGHRYDSDRHHTFILEGARDLATQLDGRGIAYRLFAPQGKERSPLRSLARRAALTVVEDFPAPPFPRWTSRLADAVDSPVWAVDACCVLPMRSFGRSYDRAFAFRKRAWRGMMERIRAGWSDVELEAAIEPWSGDAGFAAVDPRRIDIADFVAGCDIDHSIGPVAHTRGGSTEGEARWRRFLESGLSSYHRLRNDAAVEPPRGVSRLSAYFHYGFISPRRVAQEALDKGGKGAEKFLDELLVWRELAYLYCFHHHGRIESLGALPEWAQETLERHRHDTRPELFSWQQLLRGRTGYEVWDLAQRSLLVHGELHNNLRMTWGKTLAGWTKSPEQALELLIDLNHHLALDASDPASYGGLLWCLGLFDRPFMPEEPVLGSVRGRSLAAHQKRLDVESYRRRISRPACGEARRVAVVGAGVSGLVAAGILQDAGHQVRIFDKGRRPGGRLATRELRHDALRFDHGAQYFTARDPRFRRVVRSWIDEGAVAPWNARLVELCRGETRPARPGERFVGTPGMQSLAAHLARELDVFCGVQISSVEHDGQVFSLADSDGQRRGDFDALLITVPAPQAPSLLSCAPQLAARAAEVRMLPCWAVMAGFEEPLLEADFGGAFIADSPLAWAARDSSKPGRGGESWVLHASADWSIEHLEREPDEVAELLLAAFFEALGGERLAPSHLRAHRWRFARPADPPGEIFWDGALKLGGGGDWSLAWRLEGAFLAGQALAGRLLGQLAADGGFAAVDAEAKTGQLSLELA